MSFNEYDIEAVKVIGPAIQKVQRACPRIEKGGTNKHFNYDYVSEEGLVELIRDACIDNGLLLTPSVAMDNHYETVTGLGDNKNGVLVTWVQEFHLTHISGHIWPFPIRVMAQGADRGDKAVWKGLTSAHKYAWMRLLMLPTGDDPEADGTTDADYTRNAPPPRQPERPQEPRPTPAEQALGSQVPTSPTPAPQALGGNLRSPDAELEQWVNKVGPEIELIPEDFKKWGIYQKAFKAAERVHGKSAIENDKSLKFSCLDDYKSERGINRDNPFRAQHIQGFFYFAADGWYKFAPEQQAESESDEPPLPPMSEDVPF